MIDYLELERHRRSYFPLCACNAVISCLSVGLSVWMVVDSFFSGLPLLRMERLLVGLGFLCAMVVFSCNFLITTGRVLWLKVSLGILICCLIVDGFLIVYQEHILVSGLAILLSLLGLLLLNSKRHRLFCERFKFFRNQKVEMLRTGGAVLHPSSRNGGKMRRKSKTSRRDIAIHNRLRDLESKAAAARRRARNKITYPIGALVVLLIIGALGYLIYDGFASGYIMLGGRGQPVTRYTLSAQPGGFWFGITMYIILIMLLIAMLGLMRLMWKMEARE